MSRVAGAGIGPADGPVADAEGAYQQMEAAFLRQLLSASGAFKPSEVAGGQVRADMFIEAMADAVAKGGGIGIGRMLQESMEAQGVGGAASDEAGKGAGGGARAPHHAPSLIHAGAAALGGVPMSMSTPRSTSTPTSTPMAMPISIPTSMPTLTPMPTPAILAPATSTATPGRALTAVELNTATAPSGGLPLPPPHRVTSGFGRRVDPIDGAHKFHPGIDLRAAAGDPIRVAGEGVVRHAGPRGGYGNAVEVDHGGGVTTLYAHASEVTVKPGEKVSAQQEIGRVGQTGRATGPHLHFEVRLNDRQVDPTRYAGVVNRALNAYQRRAEDTVAGTQSPRGGERP